MGNCVWWIPKFASERRDPDRSQRSEEKYLTIAWTSVVEKISAAIAAVSDDTMAAVRAGSRGEDFSFQGQSFIAKVVDVYDGDTVRVLFAAGDDAKSIVQYRVRMLGYNSPELKPRRDAPGRDEEKVAAAAARDAITERVMGAIVYMSCAGFDKYGRLLATLYTLEGENINDWMVINGYGHPYTSPRD